MRCSTRAGVQVLANALAVVVLAFPVVASEKEPDLAAVCEKFNAARSQAKEELLAAFDKLDKSIESARPLAEADRAVMLTDVRAARAKVADENKMTPILAMHPAYVKFITTVRKSFRSVETAYSRAIRSSTGPRRIELTEELVNLTESVNALDSLQVDQPWKGYRSDYRPAARIQPTPFSCRKFRLVQDGNANVDFTLRVEKRRGNQIVAEVSQNNGAFVAEAAGTFDGLNLLLKMTRMRRGPDRYFEYQGQLVGGLGFLEMRGIKTDGNPGAGRIVLVLEE